MFKQLTFLTIWLTTTLLVAMTFAVPTQAATVVPAATNGLTITVPAFITQTIHSLDAACPSIPIIEPTIDSHASLTQSVSEWLGTALVDTLLPQTVITEPVNILLMGSDSRSGESYGHTDTMILATIDPVAKTVAALSIPRDLWVTIPGYGENRINNAYRWGQIKEHPGGGPALVAETVEANLGVSVDHYVLVKFEAFEQFVDTLGGVEVCVPERLDAAAYYGYPADEVNPDEYYSFVPLSAVEPLNSVEPVTQTTTEDELAPRGYQFLYIEAGSHQLDGATALRYARSRASVTADFARVQRQQAVLLAVREKALQMGVITKLPELWDTLGGLVETDLPLTDMFQWAALMHDTPRENITMRAISHQQTMDHTTADGARVLLPNRSEIATLVTELFGPPQPVTIFTPAESELGIALK